MDEVALVERLAKLATDQDAFVVLYGLVETQEPLPLEKLWQDWGAYPQDMKDIIDKLGTLGLVNRRGHSIVASDAARTGLTLLEKLVSGARLEGLEASASRLVTLQSGSRPPEMPPVPGTNNSTWLSISGSAPIVTSDRCSDRTDKSNTGSRRNVIVLDPVGKELEVNAASGHAYL